MKTFLAGLLFVAALASPVGAWAQDAPGGADINVPNAGRPPVHEERAPDIVQDYEPDPAIWVVRDEDTRIYLLGTVHALPEGFRWRSPRLDAIVTEADELILETSDKDAAEGSDFAGLTASFAKRPPVSKRLSPANGEKWLALAELLGMDPAAFDRLPPLLAMIGIGASHSIDQTGATPRYGVETVLEADFEAAGKPIGSIENAGDVLASLLELDEAVLIKQLDRQLTLWDGKSLESMLYGAPQKAGNDSNPRSILAEQHAWAQGREVDIRAEVFGYTAFDQSMGKRLLDNRNRAWAGWLQSRLATPGTVLVAVGAAHLGGLNSVQEMLSRRGLAAERLD